ncbi:DUF6339 family protein [Pseudosulfitobacter sp. SM2401]|uniref:DUF6339 family protein n=1 Tax=Pseudosulfitobacter sp. SM2401 TaxID=3350098 RepID=UPI0036F404A5
MHKLKYFSESVLAELRANVSRNLERYRASGFGDRTDQNGWAMELSAVEVEPEKLAVLSQSGGSAAEISNSMLVFEAIEGMTPSLATEERVWSRLTHFECLDYTRGRWPIKDDPREKNGLFDGLTGAKEKANEKRKKVLHQNITQVEKHYFARGRTGYRDDNSVARLWWNAYIAKRIDHQDQEGVLIELLRTADIRSNLVERPMLSNRADLMRGIIRTMRNHPDIYGAEITFRDFMKAVNIRGGGVLFEALSTQETDGILLKCRDDALRKGEKASQAA